MRYKRDSTKGKCLTQNLSFCAWFIGVCLFCSPPAVWLSLLRAELCPSDACLQQNSAGFPRGSLRAGARADSAYPALCKTRARARKSSRRGMWGPRAFCGTPSATRTQGFSLPLSPARSSSGARPGLPGIPPVAGSWLLAPQHRVISLNPFLLQVQEAFFHPQLCPDTHK